MWFVLVGLLPLSLTPPVPCGCCGGAEAGLGGFTFRLRLRHLPTLMQTNKPGRITKAGKTGIGWGLLDWVGPCFKLLCVSCTFSLFFVF